MSTEIPVDIQNKYPRKFVFKDVNRKTITARGMATDVLLLYSKGEKREHWKGVEKLMHESGLEEFRFMYLTRRLGETRWKWGQFNVCLETEQFSKLLRMMKRENWI